MTIAIQGDWGSGKTSMMELIKSTSCCDPNDTDLEKKLESEPVLYPIWFNTWQYSQFNTEGSLSASLLSNFLEEISKYTKDDKTGELRKTIKNIAMVGLSAVIKKTTNIDEKDIINAAAGDTEKLPVENNPAKLLHSLREEVTKAVESVISKDSSKGIQRFVVFIDDLDRLVPIKAVELLESLKLFLDVPNCVFILACDYKIIVQGLSEKVGEGEVNGRSFFDKIIQVPYNMPVHLYEVDTYISDLLTKISVRPNKKTLPKYRLLLESSIGLNPRSFKRLFNSFLLLNMIIEQKEGKDGISITENREIANPDEIDLVKFAVLCLQTEYEDELHVMRKLGVSLNGSWFEEMQNNKNFQENFYNKVHRLSTGKIKSDNKKSSFLSFLKVFFNSIQLEAGDDEETLSDHEAEFLRSIINSSSVLGVSQSEQTKGLSKKEELIIQILNTINIEMSSNKFPLGELLDESMEIAWSTDHNGTCLFIEFDTSKMKKNVKINIGFYNEKPRSNHFKEYKSKFYDLDTADGLTDWDWEQNDHTEDYFWYRKTIALDSCKEKETLDDIKDALCAMNNMGQKIGIELI
jgi:hypothetical protein